MRITWRLLLPFYHLRYILLEIAIVFAIIRNLSLSNFMFDEPWENPSRHAAVILLNVIHFSIPGLLVPRKK